MSGLLADMTTSASTSHPIASIPCKIELCTREIIFQSGHTTCLPVLARSYALLRQAHRHSMARSAKPSDRSDLQERDGILDRSEAQWGSSC